MKWTINIDIVQRSKIQCHQFSILKNMVDVRMQLEEILRSYDNLFTGYYLYDESMLDKNYYNLKLDELIKDNQIEYILDGEEDSMLEHVITTPEPGFCIEDTDSDLFLKNENLIDELNQIDLVEELKQYINDNKNRIYNTNSKELIIDETIPEEENEEYE